MYHLIENHLPPKLPVPTLTKADLDKAYAELTKYPSFKDHPPVIPFPMADELSKLAKTLHKEWQAHIQRVFIDAILKENDGVMPSNEELYKWAKCYTMPDGTHILTWGAPPYAVGEKVETKYIIAQVAPPL